MSRINRQKYTDAFKKADQDNSGLINQEEMKQVLTALGKELVGVDRIFAKFDEDKSGQIDLNEFLLFMDDVDNAWVRVQAKTFTRWASTALSNRMLKINDILVDLRDGILLAPLIEVLARKPLKCPNAKCKMTLQKVENLNACLTFLKNDGIKLVNIGSEDLEKGNEKITLGLIWTLILKYQIGDTLEEGGPKWVLLQWVKNQVLPYGMGQNLKNFKTGWSDGKVLSALTDSLDDHKIGAIIDCTNISADPYLACQHAIQTAEEKYEIPAILDAPDLVENPDEHSIMTYVSYFRDWADKMANRAHPGHTCAEGPGVEGGDSRSGATDFKIISKNQQGKPLKVIEDPFAFGAKVTMPDGSVNNIELTNNGDGTLSGKYPLTSPGDYKVDIVLRNEPIKGSTFTAHFEAGNSSLSYCEGAGLIEGKTNRPCVFKIISVDKDGNRLGSGGDPFEVVVTGPFGKLVHTQRDVGNGTYDVAYSPDVEGDHKIDVTLFGNHVKDSPFTSTIKRAPNGNKSWVEGEGTKKAYLKKQATFTVHAMDDAGRPVWGDDCSVTIAPDAGGSEVKAVVTDNNDGTYSVSYTPVKSGMYTISVTLDFNPVSGTPFNLKFSNQADASTTSAEGAGVEGGDSRAESADFRVVSKNDQGEPIIESDEEVRDALAAQVTYPDGSVQTIPLTDNGDGTYGGNYNLRTPGDYKVDVSLRGAPIKDSTFTAHFEAGNAENSYCLGDGLIQGKTNRPCAFKIISVDKDGSKVKVGGDPFTVAIMGPEGKVVHQLNDNKDGTYNVTFAPQDEGAHTIAVELFGCPVKGSSFSPMIKRSPNSSKSWVSGDGTKRAFNNRPAKFTVHAVDDVGQPVSGDDCAIVISYDADGNEVKADITDNGDGTYSVVYAPQTAGDITIKVSLDGQAVNGTPVKLKVRVGADASKSGHAVFKVTIAARDKDGNSKAEGGDDWEVQCIASDESEVVCKTADNGDGTYSVTYKLSTNSGEPKEYHVQMKLNGDNIAGSPFKQFM